MVDVGYISLPPASHVAKEWRNDIKSKPLWQEQRHPKLFGTVHRANVVAANGFTSGYASSGCTKLRIRELGERGDFGVDARGIDKAVGVDYELARPSDGHASINARQFETEQR